MKRLKNSSIFVKTVILNLILLFAVIMFTLVNHTYVSKMFRQNQISANDTYLSIVLRQVDSYLSNIINYASDTLNDSDLIRLKTASVNSDEYFDYIRLISDEFYKAKYSLSLNPDFYLYIKESGSVVSCNGIDDISTLMAQDKINDLNLFLSKLENGASGELGGNMYFVCANDSRIILFYMLTADTLKNYTYDMSSLMGEGVYSDIVMADGTNIFYDESLPIYSKSDQFVCQSKTGSMYGLTYNIYRSVKGGMQQNGVFNIYTLIIALAFIALNCITIYVSYKLHMPLKQIVMGYSRGDEKNNNEYNVISEILDDLSDKNRKIEHQLKNSAKSLYGFCIYKIFHGRHDYDEELLKRLEERVKYYFVVTCLFEFDTKEEYRDHSAELSELFAQTIPKDCEIYNVIETKGQYSYMFCNIEYSVDIAEQLSDEFYKKYGNSAFLSMGISQSFDRVSDAQGAYMQSCIALQNQKINDSYRLFYNVYSDSIEMNEDFTPFITREVEHNVISQLLAGNEKLAEEFLYQISMLLHKDMHYVEIKQMFISVDNLLKIVYKSSNLVYHNLFGKEEPEMSELYSPKLMFSVIKERIAVFLDYRKRVQNDLYDNIVDYIRENIAGELYREKIAKEFGITPEYLSSYFKKTSGESMVDFIHKEKINKAKELLAGNRKLKVYEVSEMVGISNVKTFIRIFKQYTGVTPKQFQTDHAEN